VVLSQVFPARPSSIPDIRNFVRRCLAESPLTEEGIREVGETVFRALLDAAGPTGSINVAFRIFPEHVEVDVLHSDSLLPEIAGQQRADGQTGAGQAPVQTSPGQSSQGQPGEGQAGQGQWGQGQAGEGQSGQGQAGEGPSDQGQAREGQAGQGQAGHGQPAPGPGGDDQGRPGEEGRDQAAIDAAVQAATTPSSTVRLGGPGQPATFAEWMSVALRREGLTQEAAARQLGVSVKTVSRWVGGTTEPRMRDLRRIQEVFGTLPLP
jgi:DNA-binding XRE family transcriptional regulator